MVAFEMVAEEEICWAHNMAVAAASRELLLIF